jgi:hypothetical protein
MALLHEPESRCITPKYGLSRPERVKRVPSTRHSCPGIFSWQLLGVWASIGSASILVLLLLSELVKFLR